jgi:hypothetical protein
MPETPRPFISHSSADKERFVLRFAERLRAKGIDAWVDTWEMLPGDSLVDKIFNEGLKNCTGFIIVLSNNSVNSKWVREELNTAIIKRIEDNTKLIPIRLDGCEVPEALRSIVWIDVADLNAYDREFERIVNSLYGQYSKPPLGNPPSYVQPAVLQMNGLTTIDSLIFEYACKIAIDQGHSVSVSGGQLVANFEQQGISEHQIMETQEVLEGRGYIRILRVLGTPHAYDFAITKYGFDQFARSGVPNYEKICSDVAHIIVRDEGTDNNTVAKELNQPIRIIEHIFEILEQKGLIKYAQSMGGGLHMDVYWVSPELRRKLEGND